MTGLNLPAAFRELSTPLLADACVRLGLPLRIAPRGIRPVVAGSTFAGPALPVRHYGSVDIFLEAMSQAQGGEILVIDNAGRTDEGCIGDLTALEARASGLGGIVVWGCHRDTGELVQIGFPVFSFGCWPAGPTRLLPRPADALTSALLGELMIDRQDCAFADDDGVLFIEQSRVRDALSTAREIWETERRQAEKIWEGLTLRQQLQFDEYLARRAANPAYTFRQHLKSRGGAIEE